jgi:hypothetical protein
LFEGYLFEEVIFATTATTATTTTIQTEKKLIE